jgi:hypothetical protein
LFELRFGGDGWQGAQEFSEVHMVVRMPKFQAPPRPSEVAMAEQSYVKTLEATVDRLRAELEALQAHCDRAEADRDRKVLRRPCLLGANRTQPCLFGMQNWTLGPVLPVRALHGELPMHPGALAASVAHVQAGSRLNPEC